MKISQKAVCSQISSTLSEVGFSARLRAWRRCSEEVRQVVTLQKSKWGEQYYVNFGILFRELEEIEDPRPENCHVIGRLAMILQEGNPDEFVIDLEKPAESNNVERTLDGIRRARDLFLEKCLTVGDVRKVLRSHPGLLVSGEAKAFLRSKKL
jgi:hypothetical protein